MADAAQVPWDRIIGAAAASTLGVLSLSVILVGLLAYAFFGRSDDRIKLWVFGAVLLATVGLAVSVLRASDHAASGPGAVPSAAASASPAVTPSDVPVVPTAASQSVAEIPASRAASSSPASPAPVAAIGASNGVAGTWQDVDGFVYRLAQDGTRMSFVQFMNGQRTGSGAGTISGHSLNYSYLNEQTGDSGMCRAGLSANGTTIDGVCGNGANSWGFRIVRAD